MLFQKAQKRQNCLLILSLLCFAGYAAICLLSGANVFTMAAFFVGIPFYLVFPGLLLADLFGPFRHGMRALLTMLYGTGFFAALVCLSVRLGQIWLLRTAPLVLSAFFLVRAYRNNNKRLIPSFNASQRFSAVCGIFAVGVLCLLFALAHSAENAHPLVAGAIDLNRDLLWNIGNGNAFTMAFPPQDIRFSEVRFSYHYLTEILAAGLCLVSGASSYDVFVFFSGPVFLSAELLAAYCLGRCFYFDVRKKAAAFPVLMFGFQCASLWAVADIGESIFGNTLLKHLLTNINSQATAVVYLSVFCVVFITAARLKFAIDWRFFLAGLSSFFMMTYAKGPQAALLLCAFIAAMVLILVFQKPCYFKAGLFLCGVSAVFVGVYPLLYASGANSSMAFSAYAMQYTWTHQMLTPLRGWLLEHVPVSPYVWLALTGVLNVFLMLPFQTALWIRAIPKAVTGITRLDAGRVLAHAAAFGGFLAYHIFLHPNSSQVYFALLAMIFASLLAVDELYRLRKKTLFSGFAILCAAVGLCSALFMAGTYSVKGAHQLLATAGVASDTVGAGAVTAQDEEAMNWLKANSDKSTVFATNRTSSTPDTTDGISNVYSALSARQGYMEGWTYAVSNMGVSQTVVEHKQQVNNALFSGTLSFEQISELCAQEGITCLIYAKAYPGVAPAVSPDFENENVAVYLMN